MPRSVREILEQAETLARRFENEEPDRGDGTGAEALAALHRAVLARATAEAQSWRPSTRRGIMANRGMQSADGSAPLVKRRGNATVSQATANTVSTGRIFT
jgi:hypothetical protein